MNRFFNIEDLCNEANPELQEDKFGIVVQKYIDLQFEFVKSFKEIAGRLPLPGFDLDMWTINSFSAFTIIPVVLREYDFINELVVSTFSINTRIVNALIRVIDKGKVGHVSLLINESLITRLPATYHHLTALAETRSEVITIRFGWNHSKITLIQPSDQYYILTGSGNWGDNSQFEQYTLRNNIELFNFYKTAITRAAIR
jgi:hypothetical protein